MAGLAKRIEGKVDASVRRLTKPDHSGNPTTRVEFRILDFQVED